MLPQVLERIKRAWLHTFETEVVAALPRSSLVLGVRNGFVPPDRYIRPHKGVEGARDPDRLDTVTTLMGFVWKDQITRPPAQFTLISAANRFDVGLDWDDNELKQQLKGTRMWSYELVSHLVGIIAKKNKLDGSRNLITSIALVNFSNTTTRNQPTRGVSADDVEIYTRSRIREHRHATDDIYAYQQFLGFGLLDQHYFAIIVSVSERKIHIINSMPTPVITLAKIEEVSHLLQDRLCTDINSYSPIVSTPRCMGICKRVNGRLRYRMQ